MVSPVGHSVAGWAVYRACHVGKPGFAPRSCLFLLSLVVASAPDLDFIPGFFVGDLNRFHQGISHSLGFMLMLATVGAVLGGRQLVGGAARFVILFCALYGSHLVLDCLTFDGSAPIGIPIFWPLSGERFISGWTLFDAVHHGIPGSDTVAFLRSSFSLHNIGVALIEVLVLTPIALAVGWIRNHLKNPLSDNKRQQPKDRQVSPCEPMTGRKSIR